ncbi:glycosyltransferase family 2 protein [Streptomyces sp. NPDC000151]|uniref:glycosyltransferase family 2 protein n=1 Tax=Streptomyces sp. NPDC000151 TaxID=3154244 RepID=UPI00332C4577
MDQHDGHPSVAVTSRSVQGEDTKTEICSPVGDAPSVPRYDYEKFSRLAGPLTPPHPDPANYRVQYRSLLSGGPHRVWTALLLVGAPLASLALLIWLLQPLHWVHREYAAGWETAADAVMLVSIGLLETFRVLNVVSIAHATLVARDPVPVTPAPGTRVAFLTTFVPGKEPVEMVRATLEGAMALRHNGPLDVWLLDEGNTPEMRRMCEELGVRHFSRKGVEKWNRPTGSFRARTKHGNYNSWLDAHGDAYEFLAGVDTDHVPLPAYLERMMGFFRDPDVAFVVGPQVYGNDDSTVARASESQQFLFHALIQRAGNAYGSPMFVGTNNCVRISALRQAGGFYDSITEDMATGLEIHRRRNPATGRPWRSVYTPDVLAVGEGPATWSDFFNQQLRWSRGTYESLFRQFGRAAFRLTAGQVLNYALMVTYYPIAAVNWMIGGLSCALFLCLGASGVQVESRMWMMLYSDAAALQIGLYMWNRRHNVSPHEPQGSSGMVGMAMSAMAAPLYARSLTGAVLRRKAGFIVTSKGGTANPDRLRSFATHLLWAGVFGATLIASVFLNHTHAAMRTWASIALVISLAPLVVWRWSVAHERRRAKHPTPARAEPLAPAATSDQERFRELVQHALDTEAPFSWVTADALYGQDAPLRDWLEESRVPYVLALRPNDTVHTADGADARVDTLVTTLPVQAWKSVPGRADKHHDRDCSWARVTIRPPRQDGFGRWVLARRTGGEPHGIAYYVCCGPSAARLKDLVEVASSRWAVEEYLRSPDTEGGPPRAAEADPPHPPA